MTSEATSVKICYTNYRGETAIREITPKTIHFGSTEWHPEPQWLLTISVYLPPRQVFVNH